MPGGGEIDLVLGGRERQRLRPDPVLAGRQRREIIVAAFVGEDRGGDGRTFLLGGDRDAGELLAGRDVIDPLSSASAACADSGMNAVAANPATAIAARVKRLAGLKLSASLMSFSLRVPIRSMRRRRGWIRAGTVFRNATIAAIRVGSNWDWNRACGEVPVLMNARMASSWPPSVSFDRAGPYCPLVICGLVWQTTQD